MRTNVVALAVLSSLVLPLQAADKAEIDPKTIPIALKLSGETSYTLDTNGQTTADFHKQVKNQKGRPKIAPPEVDLTLTVTNTSDKPVQLWVSGDPVILTLNLKGKGAVTLKPLLAMTREFRIPETLEIPAGKSTTLPVKSLTAGMRGISEYSYWTAPGKYTLSATLRTGVSPKPKGAQESNGFGIVTLTSKPIELTIQLKK